MSMTNLLRSIGIALALSLAVSLPGNAADAAPKSSTKWIVVFNHAADAAGNLVLRFAPDKGEPVEVTTKIAGGTTENAAAEILAGSLKGQLGGAYKIKVEDGEKVYIKTSGKTPKFVLSLSSSTLTGLTVKIKRG
jgi:spermidine/putrescine-binding protein